MGTHYDENSRVRAVTARKRRFILWASRGSATLVAGTALHPRGR